MQQLFLNLQPKGTYRQLQPTARQFALQELKIELLGLQRMGLRCLEDLKQQKVSYSVKLWYLRRKAERMLIVYDCFNEADVVSMISLNETIICLEKSLEYVEEDLALRERQQYLESILANIEE